MRLEGISAHPDDVTVTVGSQQALDLVTRIFCDPGDVVIVRGARATSAHSGCSVPIRRGRPRRDGRAGPGSGRPRRGDRASRRAGRTVKFLYTIPNFHNPAGVTQSLERRMEVLGSPRGRSAGARGQPVRPARLRRRPDPARCARWTRIGWSTSARSRRRSHRGSGSAGRSRPHAVARSWCSPRSRRRCVRRCSRSSRSSAYLASTTGAARSRSFREMYRERRDAMISGLTSICRPAGLGPGWCRPACVHQPADHARRGARGTSRGTS